MSEHLVEPGSVILTFGGISIRGHMWRPSLGRVEVPMTRTLDLTGVCDVEVTRWAGWAYRAVHGLKPRSRWRAHLRAAGMVIRAGR